MVVLLDVKRVI